jgi:hypothetical protein
VSARKLRPCGTVGGYARHRLHGEEICDLCRIAWRDYHRGRRAAGYEPPEEKRAPASCGTYAAYQRHKRYGELIDEACAQAERAYKAEKAREYRAAKKQQRAAFDALLAEAWSETASP